MRSEATMLHEQLLLGDSLLLSRRHDRCRPLKPPSLSQVWEKDMLICTDWTLKFASCCPLSGGKGEEAVLHPIAFCGLHNPERDKALLGWPAGGAEAKEGHPFVIPKRTQPPYANEEIDKWASIYEKNLEIRDKRKKGKGRGRKREEVEEEGEEFGAEVGEAEQPPPKKGRKAPASRQPPSPPAGEESTAPASQRRLQKGDEGWDSEAEEVRRGCAHTPAFPRSLYLPCTVLTFSVAFSSQIALQEEILREQAKLDALRAKLKRKRKLKEEVRVCKEKGEA